MKAEKKITEAIILAGGLGTRLRSAVPDLPKCMAPVNDKPFIAYVIQHLQKEGIEKFIFSLGYKHEFFVDFLSNSFQPSIINYPLKKNHWERAVPFNLRAAKPPEKMLLLPTETHCTKPIFQHFPTNISIKMPIALFV